MQEVEDSLREAQKTVRQQESGIMSPQFIDSVCILFERLPLWLLGLEDCKVGTIFLPQFDTVNRFIQEIKITTDVLH